MRDRICVKYAGAVAHGSTLRAESELGRSGYLVLSSGSTTRERLVLLEALSRALRTEIEHSDTQGSAERLLGIIKTDVDVTDDDLDRIRFEQLMEKHS